MAVPLALNGRGILMDLIHRKDYPQCSGNKQTFKDYLHFVIFK